MPSQLIVLLISMLPISELRGAIPIAISVYKMSASAAFFWAVLGNIIPVIFILWLLKTVSNFLSHHSYFFNRFFVWLFERTRRNHSRKFERFKDLALVILVAIPLPFTGAWTGSLAAFVFGIPIKKALPLIILGVLIAGVIVSLVTIGVISLPIL
ncbi:MAG: small multi-drug export protein [Candidatus Omnitrophica bacterium]|nr:small multi-drug export protein [Candidatus Omnitrophota bacterium]